MMLKPFQIVWELIEFGLQALFLYVLALLLIVGLLIFVIADNRKNEEPVIVYKDRIVKEYIPAELTSENTKTINKQECTRPAGCRVLEDGTVEY